MRPYRPTARLCRGRGPNPLADLKEAVRRALRGQEGVLVETVQQALTLYEAKVYQIEREEKLNPNR